MLSEQKTAAILNYSSFCDTKPHFVVDDYHSAPCVAEKISSELVFKPYFVRSLHHY